MIIGEDSGTMENDKKEKRYPPPRIRVGPDSVSIADFDEYLRSPPIRDEIEERRRILEARRNKNGGDS